MAQAKTKTCTDCRIVGCHYMKEDLFQQFLLFPEPPGCEMKSLRRKIHFLLGLIWCGGGMQKRIIITTIIIFATVELVCWRKKKYDVLSLTMIF